MDIVSRVIARYKSKKKVETQDGDKVTVYEYSDRQVANRNRKKAERYEKLKKAISSLQRKFKKDLASEDQSTALTALAVALIDHTYERVGNEDSADEGHFGVTGWHRGHVSFGSGKATIKYVGKSGVKHSKEVTDAALVKALRRAYDAVEGKEAPLFAQEGARVDATKVNAYLKEFGVTAKDLRGFHANRVMQERLKAVRSKGGTLPSDPKERKAQLKTEFLKALEETAETVGHEPSTLRSQYLVPGLEDEYMQGRVMGRMKAGYDYDRRGV